MRVVMHGDRVALTLVLLGDSAGVEFSNTKVPLILFSLSSFFFAKNNFMFVVSTTFGLVFLGWLGFFHVLVLLSGLALVVISCVNGWFCSGLVVGLLSMSMVFSRWFWFFGSTINGADVSWFLSWTSVGGFKVIFKVSFLFLDASLH